MREVEWHFSKIKLLVFKAKEEKENIQNLDEFNNDLALNFSFKEF